MVWIILLNVLVFIISIVLIFLSVSYSMFFKKIWSKTWILEILPISAILSLFISTFMVFKLKLSEKPNRTSQKRKSHD